MAMQSMRIGIPMVMLVLGLIPESIKDAVILFYDHSGKVLQKFDISHRGAGSLTVYGEDLTSGVYTYSLIIDGENHQTKRMVKQ